MRIKKNIIIVIISIRSEIKTHSKMEEKIRIAYKIADEYHENRYALQMKLSEIEELLKKPMREQTRNEIILQQQRLNFLLRKWTEETDEKFRQLNRCRFT